MKTLYVCRKLLNAADLIEWAKSQGIQTTLSPDDLHVTVCYSREPLDWNQITDSAENVSVDFGPRHIKRFGTALVLCFDSPALEKRWQEFREIGASWDHDAYNPHVTITYDENVDPDSIEPFRGDLHFGIEHMNEVNEGWKDGIEETVVESFRMNIDNEKHLYQAFKRSYEAETGAAWSEDKFAQRAGNWTFYGDADGFVAVRAQQSGMKKLVGVAGDPKGIVRGLGELQAEGGPIWGAVSAPLAVMAKKRGMIVPHLVMGGPTLIKTLVKLIPPSVFGGHTPEITKDGGLEFNYPDVGRAVKYLIGNKAYFMAAMKMPQIAEKLKEVPGLKMVLKLMGLNESADALKSELFVTKAQQELAQFGDHVDAMLFEKGPTTVEIHEISATPMREGWGSKAMTVLCGLADRMGITLVLEVANETDGYDGWDDEEENDNGMPSEDQLISFYSSFGFEMTGQGWRTHMMRAPKAQEGLNEAEAMISNASVNKRVNDDDEGNATYNFSIPVTGHPDTTIEVFCMVDEYTKLYIEDVYVENAEEHPERFDTANRANSTYLHGVRMGPSSTRMVLRYVLDQVKKDYPDIKQILGNRVTGARRAAGVDGKVEMGI